MNRIYAFLLAVVSGLFCIQCTPQEQPQTPGGNNEQGGAHPVQHFIHIPLARGDLLVEVVKRAVALRKDILGNIEKGLLVLGVKKAKNISAPPRLGIGSLDMLQMQVLHKSLLTNAGRAAAAAPVQNHYTTPPFQSQGRHLPHRPRK